MPKGVELALIKAIVYHKRHWDHCELPLHNGKLNVMQIGLCKAIATPGVHICRVHKDTCSWREHIFCSFSLEIVKCLTPVFLELPLQLRVQQCSVSLLKF